MGDIRTVDYESLILGFASIIYEALPFIVLGVVIAGLLEEFIPQQAITKIIPKNRLLAIGLGGLLGIIFPMCECGIIVITKRLLRKGLPLSVCVCYMLAGPIINVVVMSSTYVAFTNNSIYGSPVNVVLLRCGLGYLIAVITSLIADRQYQKHGMKLLHPSVSRGLRHPEEEEQEEKAASKHTWLQSLNNISATALHDFVDIMAFLILGAGLATLGRVFMQGNHVATVLQETPALAIIIMMGLAIVFCLCSEADAFVCANFPMTWPPASKIAFLVFGPMLDFKLYLMYTRVFRPRFMFTIITAVATQVFVYCTILNYLTAYYVW
jgi:uncharacterized protein